MSVVTYYARLTRPQLDAWRSSHRLLDPPREVDVIDLDKAASVITWLLSPGKRIEQLHFARDLEGLRGANQEVSDPLPPMPDPDDYVVAIEGRGPNRIEIGGVSACIFEANEVQEFARLLAMVTDADLKSKVDYKLMDSVRLPVDYWEEEGDQIVAEYILPNFASLKLFYAAAATTGQLVLVWVN